MLGYKQITLKCYVLLKQLNFYTTADLSNNYIMEVLKFCFEDNRIEHIIIVIVSHLNLTFKEFSCYACLIIRNKCN